MAHLSTMRQSPRIALCAVILAACTDPAVKKADFGHLQDSDTRHGTDSQSGTETGDQCPEGDTRLCGVLAAHNEARSKIATDPPIPPLSWSAPLAESSLDWASQCVCGHSDNDQVGENIFCGTTGFFTPVEGVNIWVSEEGAYTYETDECLPDQMCLHYTQIVWRDTTSVGCAIQSCSDGNDVMVCHYDPMGNYMGQRPY